MRPIDADELKRGIEALCKDERASISAVTYFALMAFINKMPTIEAETVRHAKWEICSDGYYPYCSNCKNEPQSGEMTLLCPNCGARMDGDENMSEWISVKDKLPEDREKVLIFRKLDKEMHIARFNYKYACWFPADSDFNGSCGYYNFSTVTHWQPLPEPPKGECDNDYN